MLLDSGIFRRLCGPTTLEIFLAVIQEGLLEHSAASDGLSVRIFGYHVGADHLHHLAESRIHFRLHSFVSQHSALCRLAASLSIGLQEARAE